jgi:glycosyltransferase involved in cell wall biosynthesis
LKLLALVPYPADLSPSQRFRIEQWAPELAAAGIDVALRPFASAPLMEVQHRPGRALAKAGQGLAAALRRLRGLAEVRAHDAVLIHRAAFLMGPALLERLVAWMGRPVIFDFDDAIYLLHTTEANRALGWLKFPGKTAALCRLSRQVVVANDELAAYARPLNPRVTVVPSSVDTDRFQPDPQPPGSRLRLGWTGSSTSLTHLEAFAPTLRELVERHPIELHVHADREPRLGGVPFEWHPWTPEGEREVLSRFEVGIMPMPDDPWARGKSAMKALLYMAMGIPALCSAVGANRVVVDHGRNGLLAGTPAEWHEQLGALVASPDLRQRLGAAGRRTVEERYSKRHCAALFAQVVRAAVAGERG